MKKTLLVLFLAVSAGAQTPPPTTRTGTRDFVPIAVWYGGGKARAPMLEANPATRRDAWRADLAQIKALGFNTVRTWVDWSSAEPREGQYNFATLETVADLASEVGLRLMVQVYADSAPDWVGRKYPDSHFISISGDVMPSHGAPGFCHDHPGVRRAMLKFYSAVAERMKSRPAFYGWDLWSEPHVINWAYATYLVSPEFCFCPYSQARFRESLKAKYGTLDAINAAWYRQFESWDEVGPNRLGTILSYTDYIDWRFFIQNKLAEDLKAKYEAVKAVVPGAVATSHASVPSMFTTPLAGDGAPDDWKMSKVVDFYGTSFYPKHSFPVGRDAAWRAGLMDFARSSGGDRGFYVGELQAGVGTIALRLSSIVTAADLRMWMWTALARGAKAVNVYAWYPMSSGYESGGYGLVNLDGTVTERARAAGAVGKVIDANQALFAGARPARAEVAIVFNPMAYMVGGRRPAYARGAQGETAAIEQNSWLGPYRAFFPSSTPVDYIHINEVAEGKASRYKMVYLPYPLMITETAGRALREYVNSGGTLVSEARLAWNDERGLARDIIPGFGLHEVCGCRETAVQQTPTGKTDIQLTGDFAGLKAGDKIRGALYEETLTPLSSSTRVVGTFADGSPAIVASTFGKGRMLTIGSFLGNAYEIDRDETSARFFRGLLDWAGVESPVSSSDPQVEVRMLENGAQRVIVAFNHGTAEAKPAITVRGLTNVRNLEGGPAVAVSGTSFAPTVPAGGVGVWAGTVR